MAVIQAVAFDADETLINLRPAVTAGLEAVLVNLRHLNPSLALTREQMEQDWIDVFVESRTEPVRQIRINAMARSLARHGMSALLDQHVQLFFEVRFAHSRPYPDALDVLAKLRPDYLLGYATNGFSEAARCGLADQFAFELYAHQDGLPKKPAREFFVAVIAAARVPAESIIYVGDDYELDVLGAAAAGLRTIWLNRTGVDHCGQVQPDAVISSLSELPDAIAGLSSAAS